MENLQLQDDRGAQGIGARRFALIGFIAILLGSLCSCTMSSRQDTNTQVTVEELRRLAQTDSALFLLDVRTEPEYLAERLSFADTRIPFDSLDQNLSRLPSDKETPIYTFCRSGRRSGIAAGFLRSAGYRRVYNVTGGIVAWKEAGFETVSGQ